jgi:hypothetical protein
VGFAPAERLHGQIEKVGAEDEEQHAGRRQNRFGDGRDQRPDQVESNKV